MFYQLERNYILQVDSANSSDVDTTADFKETDPHSADRPPRYRCLVLPKDWHTKGSRPKRRSRRKNHGKISFMEMTKTISSRWHEADNETKRYCRKMADIGSRQYKTDLELYYLENRTKYNMGG